MKIPSVGAELLDADGQTGKTKQIVFFFLQFYESARIQHQHLGTRGYQGIT